MTTIAKRFILATALAVATTGAALADSGDNSMSPWTGDSYAAFNGGPVGSLAAGPVAKPTDTADASHSLRDVIIGLPREYISPFRDDTA